MDVNILRSPRIAVASVSPEKLKKISYPPNFLPGARDVNSPYGVIRVYEWGPEDGKKVLFIHGLSTPAPALGTVADTMAKQGYRVMLLGMGNIYTLKLLYQGSKFMSEILIIFHQDHSLTKV